MGGWCVAASVRGLIVTKHRFGSHLFLKAKGFGSSRIVRRSVLTSNARVIAMTVGHVRLSGGRSGVLMRVRRPNVRLLPGASNIHGTRRTIFTTRVTHRTFNAG